MAIFKDDQGKTEKPTPGRLSEARDKGQAPLSREFIMGFSLLFAVLTLEAVGPWFVGKLKDMFAMALEIDRVATLGEGAADSLAREIVATLAMIAAPVLTLMGTFYGATLLAGYGQIGIKVSKKAIGFKPERLNPVNNAKRIFSAAQLVKTVLSAAKIVILGGVLYLVLRSEWQTLANLHALPDFQSGVLIVARLAMRIFFWVAFVVLLLSIGDIAWQRYSHIEGLKMTKQEVEDERKRSEGDPLMKSRMKGARMEMMKTRMMEAIPKADVVITNPTHFSVALQYDRMRSAAPVVVAKGLDELALKIREVATDNDVPLVEDPPLARALYRAVRIGDEIPERFYKAVAGVLGHVYRLEGRAV